MTTRPAIFFSAVLALNALLLCSCNIVGPAAAIAAGPPKLDAEHKIADRPTVVFIDDRDNVVNPVALRRAIADKVSEELMVRKLVTRTISPHDAMSIASQRDRRNEVMAIDAIGREVGADQIIYVEMIAFTDQIDHYVPRGMAICRVRVIDVANRKRLYPDNESEIPYRVLEVQTDNINPDLYRSRATRMQIYELLAQDTGTAIARLFYRHEPRELGGRLGGR